ncbi:uncharacterized protein LOC141908832 isoform X1 [Tubulanus polymorphus]|uniref:uncharacterized protein LOC141908832 isoform X1 n=1 Tax=Tubulanus polymorphus TaxID=672921 RepID=UPI003DA68A8A
MILLDIPFHVHMDDLKNCLRDQIDVIEDLVLEVDEPTWLKWQSKRAAKNRRKRSQPLRISVDQVVSDEDDEYVLEYRSDNANKKRFRGHDENLSFQKSEYNNSSSGGVVNAPSMPLKRQRHSVSSESMSSSHSMSDCAKNISTAIPVNPFLPRNPLVSMATIQPQPTNITAAAGLLQSTAASSRMSPTSNNSCSNNNNNDNIDSLAEASEQINNTAVYQMAAFQNCDNSLVGGGATGGGNPLDLIREQFRQSNTSIGGHQKKVRNKSLLSPSVERWNHGSGVARDINLNHQDAAPIPNAQSTPIVKKEGGVVEMNCRRATPDTIKVKEEPSFDGGSTTLEISHELENESDLFIDEDGADEQTVAMERAGPEPESLDLRMNHVKQLLQHRSGATGIGATTESVAVLSNCANNENKLSPTSSSGVAASGSIAKGGVCYKCPICVVSFSSQKTYMEHMESHRRIRPYTCSGCRRRFMYAEYREHVRTCAGKLQNASMSGTSFICQICGDIFTESRYLRQHIKGMHMFQQLQCENCLKIFRWQSNLSRHKKTCRQKLLKEEPTTAPVT